jgi:small subunit ribosomal protein S11
VATGKKKTKKSVQSGVVHIQSTFNNTIITITDPSGGALSWASAGGSGFKGRASRRRSRRRSPRRSARRRRWSTACAGHRVHQGPGSGRESAVRAIQAAGIKVTLIKDVTPIPHNGCRPKKRRRV